MTQYRPSGIPNLDNRLKDAEQARELISDMEGKVDAMWIAYLQSSEFIFCFCVLTALVAFAIWSKRK